MRRRNVCDGDESATSSGAPRRPGGTAAFAASDSQMTARSGRLPEGMLTMEKMPFRDTETVVDVNAVIDAARATTTETNWRQALPVLTARW